MSDVTARPPRENLLRGLAPEFQDMRAGEVRADETTDPATLVGRFAVFNTPTEIDSIWEGRFIERVAPGAFKKTMREGRDQMRVLLEHGHDPQLGNKPIGEITELREDETGAYYEARLFDGVPPLVMDGLRAGQYGASFRFRVLREEFVEEPGVSADNPLGLPERTLKEVEVREFGPVTWGAYPDATANVRSLTDEFVIDRLALDPERLTELVEKRRERLAGLEPAVEPVATETAPSDEPEADPQVDPERREQDPKQTEAPAAKATPRDYLHGTAQPPAWFLP